MCSQTCCSAGLEGKLSVDADFGKLAWVSQNAGDKHASGLAGIASRFGLGWLRLAQIRI